MPITSKSKFSDFDLKRIKDELGRITTVTADVTSAINFFQGDHWQNELGWVGPSPAPNSTNRSEIMEKIRTAFVFKNAIAEVVNRHADGVLARADSSWYLSPVNTGLSDLEPVTGDTREAPSTKEEESDDEEGEKPKSPEQQKIDELTPVINLWWAKRDVGTHIRSAVEKLLSSGRGGIRLFIPQGKLQDGGVPKGELLEVIEYIYVDSPEISEAGMLQDGFTMEEAYLHVWNQYNVEDKKEYEYSLMVYVDSNTKLTVMKFESNDPQATAEEIPVDLGGHNIYFEMRRKPLITSAIMTQQKLLNLALSMMGRNAVMGGFLERIILSADLPGKWVDDPSAPGGKRYENDPIDVGSGVTTVLQPMVYEDAEGKQTVIQPDVRYRDPVSPEHFTETKTAAYHCILEEAEQTHMMIADQGFASGEARIQARAGYANSLLRTKPQVDNVLSAMLTTLVQMLGLFTGSPEQYRDLKVISDARPDTGPLTPEEKRVTIEMYKSGLLSREATMVVLGVDNPDEEIKKIDSEVKVTTPLEKAAMITALSKTGWELDWDQLPQVDTEIFGLAPRNVQKYIQQLKMISEMQAPAGGNGGAKGGENKEGPNGPKKQSPGPSRTQGNPGAGSNGGRGEAL